MEREAGSELQDQAVEVCRSRLRPASRLVQGSACSSRFRAEVHAGTWRRSVITSEGNRSFAFSLIATCLAKAGRLRDPRLMAERRGRRADRLVCNATILWEYYHPGPVCRDDLVTDVMDVQCIIKGDIFR